MVQPMHTSPVRNQQTASKLHTMSYNILSSNNNTDVISFDIDPSTQLTQCRQVQRLHSHRTSEVVGIVRRQIHGSPCSVNDPITVTLQFIYILLPPRKVR